MKSHLLWTTLLLPASAGSLSWYMDNDALGRTDVEYTSGLRLAYAFKVQDDGRWRGLSLSHQMFTPKSWWLPSPPLDERPYAGWLGVGFGHGVLEGGHRRTLEWTLGVTGEASLAEPLQDIAHSLENYEGHKGWDSQLPSELTFNVFYREDWRVAYVEGDALDVDAWVGTFGAAGTYKNELGLSAVMRIGWNLEPALSSSRYSHTAYHFQRESEEPSFHVNLGAQLAYVPYFLPLEGGFFHEYETEIDPHSFVAEWFIGGEYSRGRQTYGLGFVFRTAEYSEAERHEYGYLKVSYAF